MKENLKALTSLRFIAAAAILVHHSWWYFGYGKSLSLAYPLDSGVSFFFVLSGFVLFYVHPRIESVRSALDFFGSRIARIWPAHVAMLLLVVLFLSRPWGTGPADPAAHSAFFANLFLIQSWYHHPSDFFSFNGASWSISTEMFFYAVFPLLVWRWETTKYFKLAATAALAVACISRASHLGLSPLSDKNVLSIDAYVYIYPPARLFEFTLGIFTASIWQDSKAASFDSMKATSLQGLAALLLVCGVPILIKLYGMLFEHHIIPASAQKWLFACGSAPIFAFVIYAMALSRGLFARAISSRVLVFLGEISFSVYMTHQVIIIALTANGKLASFGPMSLQYAIYWCFVIGFSIALWVFVEKPSRRFIVYMLRRWTHRKAAEITTRVASSFESAGPAT